MMCRPSSAAGNRVTNLPERSPAGRFARSATLLVAVFVAAFLATGASAREPVDPELRAKLAVAIADGGSFNDRFDGQVWLTDMAGRLGNRVDADEALSILVHVHREATRAGLPPEMVLAVIDVESNFQRYAVSRANAQGLMQIMRFWLDELDMPGHALFDIQQNIRMGCTILRHYYDIEKGNWTRALARYNGSLGRNDYPNRVFERLRTRWYRG